MENKNSLTEEQKAFLEQNFRAMKEKDLFQKLSELGPKVDESAFKDALRTLSFRAEEEVFRREVSEEELASTDGGLCGLNGFDCHQTHWDSGHCTEDWARDIYEGGFPNCAATVEEGSWCGSNDACYTRAVDYKEMQDCKKAWR